ncbi:ABC transporter ATP-binding protein [Paraburkholderia caribensis]|uniref:ABC transporter ATP-binding protein n=1 Tax=Paraburkholderia caribensis TaxID=75105 RepID=UPI0034D2FD30
MLSEESAAHSSQPFVEVDCLSKRYRDDAPFVFEDVSFRINRGEFICVIGHSGCGKSTILNVLAGLEEASNGVAIMAGREISGPSLDRGVVFQGHALLPWLTAKQNVAFAVRSRHPEWTKQQIDEHALRFLDMVGLARAADKKPSELSGGMKQRVGIARAFSVEPKMLMMDEPFGALDALTRGVIQDELLKICAATRQTVFMITHDVDEAILLADRIFLMSNGPHARLAEIVVNPLSRTRSRESLVSEPRYYAVRNYLIDFLVRRSALIQQGIEGGASQIESTRVVNLEGAEPVDTDFGQRGVALRVV